MKYVLDSSVAFKWAVRKIDTDKALALGDATRQALHTLVAPDVFPAEVGHALTRAERQKRIDPADGWNAWLAVMADAHRLVSFLALMPRAYAISSRMRSGLYDCLYVALAEQESCELVTCESKLLNNLGRQFPFIVSLSSLP